MKRNEEESFEDYKVRRTTSNKATKRSLKGKWFWMSSLIKTFQYPGGRPATRPERQAIIQAAQKDAEEDAKKRAKEAAESSTEVVAT